jgi:hypothetical protein
MDDPRTSTVDENAMPQRVHPQQGSHPQSKEGSSRCQCPFSDEDNANTKLDRVIQ